MPSIAKDKLRALLKTEKLDAAALAIAKLRLEYTDLQHALSHYITVLLRQDRIHPRILPTQASGRWSTVNPPLTNFDKRCINPDCPSGWHEKRDTCWSVRDCVIPDPGTYWIEGDLDAIEARIFALKVEDHEAIAAFNRDLDIHTPTACYLFDLPYPGDAANPHTSATDTAWRAAVKWRGKDDTRRGIAKNFRYGTQYCLKPEAVLSIKDLEEFDLSRRQILTLAYKYWHLTQEQQQRKFAHMQRIRKTKVARTLYGARRVFFDGSDDTAKAGFNHEIQGTVVDYMNEVLLKIMRHYPEAYLIHNAHDGYKIAFPYHGEPTVATTLASVKVLTEGSLCYQGHSVSVTATVKVTHCPT